MALIVGEKMIFSAANRILQETKDLESYDADDLFAEDMDMYDQEKMFKNYKYDKDMHGNQFSKTLIVVILFLAIVLVMWNIFKALKETTAVSIYASGNHNKEGEKILGDVEVTTINKKEDAEIV